MKGIEGLATCCFLCGGGGNKFMGMESENKKRYGCILVDTADERWYVLNIYVPMYPKVSSNYVVTGS